MTLSDNTRRNIPLLIDGALIIALLGLTASMASWKGQIEEQVTQTRQEIQAIRAIRISPEADRRLSVVEIESVNTQRQIAEMKADLVRRLERIDSKIDRISQ